MALPLTPLEISIVRLLSSGLSEKEVAEVLIVEPKTINKHKIVIYRKLGFSSRVILTHYAIRRGLLEVMKFTEMKR